jgi:hypothetical protein
VREVRRQLLLHLFVSENLQQALPETELRLYKEKCPVVLSQKCSFLSECYGYKYLGKVNGQSSYILQKHCIDHCQVENCPHKDEPTVELSRIIPPPDYSHLIQNGNSLQAVDVHQQGYGS